MTLEADHHLGRSDVRDLFSPIAESFEAPRQMYYAAALILPAPALANIRDTVAG